MDGGDGGRAGARRLRGALLLTGGATCSLVLALAATGPGSAVAHGAAASWSSGSEGGVAGSPRPSGGAGRPSESATGDSSPRPAGNGTGATPGESDGRAHGPDRSRRPRPGPGGHLAGTGTDRTPLLALGAVGAGLAAAGVALMVWSRRRDRHRS
ncbi:hypothetical protein [Streptomyces sp. bgisy153]|uniref:hypothetical protein n=1 Tax=Streptomyces sp. bgisy153 TaxID=3413793 RepID=UPI003D71B9BD